MSELEEALGNCSVPDLELRAKLIRVRLSIAYIFKREHLDTDAGGSSAAYIRAVSQKVIAFQIVQELIISPIFRDDRYSVVNFSKKHKDRYIKYPPAVVKQIMQDIFSA